MIDKAVIQDATRYCVEQANETGREACGVVIDVNGKQEFHPCRNVALDEKGEPALGVFEMHYVDYADACDKGEPVAIVHSHVGLPPELSDVDRICMARDTLPWLVIATHTGEAKLHHAPQIDIDYVGRPYQFNASDCYTLVMDWYRREHGIELYNHPRTEGFEYRGEDILMPNAERAGFHEVSPESMRVGDVLIIRSDQAPVDNHCGVYLGDNFFLHHLYMRPSRKDVYGSYWRKRTTHVMRHKDLTPD